MESDITDGIEYFALTQTIRVISEIRGSPFRIEAERNELFT